MGALLGGSLFVEGLFARFMYVCSTACTSTRCTASRKVLFDTLAQLITRRTEPRVKLH